MDMISKKNIITVGVIVILLIIAGVFFSLRSDTKESKYFSLSEKDKTSEINWDLPTINLTEEGRIRAEKNIENVQKIKAEVDEYEYHMSLATNYRLLKKGEEAYDGYIKAIETLPEKSLAYGNLGELLETTGAIYSARTAFEKARDLEPQFVQNHIALIDFYIRNFNTEKQIITSSYTKAIEHLGQNEDVLKSQALWFEQNGDIQAAIELWRKILITPENKTAIQTKIQALEAKN